MGGFRAISGFLLFRDRRYGCLSMFWWFSLFAGGFSRFGVLGDLVI